LTSASDLTDATSQIATSLYEQCTSLFTGNTFYFPLELGGWNWDWGNWGNWALALVGRSTWQPVGQRGATTTHHHTTQWQGVLELTVRTGSCNFGCVLPTRHLSPNIPAQALPNHTPAPWCPAAGVCVPAGSACLTHALAQSGRRRLASIVFLDVIRSGA